MQDSLKGPEKLGKLPSVKKKKFPNGKRGNYATVQFIKSVARKYSGHQIIRQLAVNIVNHYGTKSHNHIDEAKAIADFVKRKVQYVKDPHSIEYIQEPTLIVEKIAEGTARGDCDDMVTLLCALLLSVGIQPYVAIVRYKENAGAYQHIYVVVYENNYRQKKERVALDAIVKDRPIGYEVNFIDKKEFLI